MRNSRWRVSAPSFETASVPVCSNDWFKMGLTQSIYANGFLCTPIIICVIIYCNVEVKSFFFKAHQISVACLPRDKFGWLKEYLYQLLTDWCSFLFGSWMKTSANSQASIFLFFLTISYFGNFYQINLKFAADLNTAFFDNRTAYLICFLSILCGSFCLLNWVFFFTKWH